MTQDNPAAEMLQRGVRPLEPYPGSNKKWKSECATCGEIVYPRYDTVVRRGLGGCNLCAKKMAAKKRFRESEAEYIAKAEELNFLPLEDYPGAQQKWKVKCLGCNQVLDKKAQSLMLGKGCSKCVNKEKSVANTAASKSRADSIMLSRQIEPLGPYKGWTRKYPGKCLLCGDFVAPIPRSLESGQGGCTTCGINRRAKTRRDAAHLPKEAAQIMLAAGCRVDDVASYPGVNKPWPGRCLNCGLRTKASLNNVLAGHGVCRPCAQSESDSAFDYFGPGVLYLLKNEQLKHLKIGIMGEKTNRLASHKSKGWQVIQTWSFAHGYEANYVEQYCLEAISDLGATSTLIEEDMPQGGHTETFQMNAISVNRVQQLIQSEIRRKRWPTPKAFLSGEAKPKPRRTCTAQKEGYECTSIYYSNGFCTKHYAAYKKYGDPFHRIRQEFTNDKCEVFESGKVCGQEATRRGMCKTHASRYYIHGDATVLKRPAPKPLTGRCSIGNCEKKDVSLGLCKTHYHEKRRQEKRQSQSNPRQEKKGGS